MPNTTIKLCATLHTILQDENVNHFNVAKIRDIYLSISNNQKTTGKAYNYVYRYVAKLEKKGLLNKLEEAVGKAVTYEKNEQFFKAKFTLIPAADYKINKQQTDLNNTKNTAIKHLNERLKKSEIDLLSSIGESEEYMRLYQSFPNMKSHLESEYLQARENSSKLLGQIKAIKSTLAHQRNIT